MKTLRFHVVLMMLQACLVTGVNAKQCTVAGVTHQPLTQIVLKNFNGAQTTNTDSSGRFRFRVTIRSVQYFQLTTNKTIHLALIPGDSIFVTLGNTPHVSPANGSAVISNYLIDWDAYTEVLLTNFDRTAFYSKDPASFIHAVAEQHDSLSAPLKRLLLRTPGVNKEFVRIETQRLRFWVWCPLNRYEYRYQLYTGKKAQLPANFYDYLLKVNFNDPSFLQLSDFDDFVNTFLEMKLFAATQQNGKSFEDPYFSTKVLLDVIRHTFTNRTMLDDILYHNMWGQIYYMDVNDSLLAVIGQTIKDRKHIATLRKLFASLQKFQAGHAAPDFSLSDAEDRVYTLKDFWGRYLLIDVWGVYCGPCLKELPSLKEIEAEFHDANITFMAVNLDGTRETWMKRIKELNLDGMQCMAASGWDSEFRKTFGIEQVPTFILIDREGRFIDSRAAFPSKGLRQTLNSLPSIRND